MKKILPAIIVILLIASVLFIPKIMNSTQAPASLFWGIAQEGIAFDKTNLQQAEDDIDIPISFLEFFLMWPKNPSTPPPSQIASSFENIWNFGAVPILTWEPMYIEKDQNVTISYQSILMGRYDTYLDNMAAMIQTFKHPVLIRFAHEMNIDQYHWGTTKDKFGPNSPLIYIKMYQYVVDFFKKRGVKNALWVFCPNHHSIPNPFSTPSAKWNHASHYYPGDRYVDIMGMDGYNWGTSATKEKDGWDSHWQSFKQVFSLLHNELNNIAPYKPVIVFETASSNIGGNKTQWLKHAIDQAKHWNLKGMVWFQIDKEQKWALHKNQTRTLDRYFLKKPSSQVWTEELIQ